MVVYFACGQSFVLDHEVKACVSFTQDIIVHDASGKPIANAVVSIVRSFKLLDPQIEIDLKDSLLPDPPIKSDSEGRASIVVFPVVKSLTISKNGYETYTLCGHEEVPKIVVMSRSRKKSK